MQHAPSRLLPHALLGALLGASACILDPEIIGGTITSGSGADSASNQSSGDVDSGGSGEPSTAYGEPCALAGFEHPVQMTGITEQPACEGGLCLFLYEFPPPTCESDDECALQSAYSTCNPNGSCNIDQELIDDLSRCTQTCESTAECPEVPGCMTEVLCMPVVTNTSPCCQKVCACRDHIGDLELAAKFAACDDPKTCS